MHTFNVNLWADLSVKVEASALPSVKLDGRELDPRIVAWALEYGFRQGIRDAAAAEKTDELRNAKALKRIDALVDNTLREASVGNRLTPVEREMRAIAERTIRAAFDDPSNAGWVAQQRQATGLGLAELREAAVKAHLKGNEAALRAEAEANLAKAPSIKLDLSTLAADAA